MTCLFNRAFNLKLDDKKREPRDLKQRNKSLNTKASLKFIHAIKNKHFKEICKSNKFKILYFLFHKFRGVARISQQPGNKYM